MNRGFLNGPICPVYGIGVGVVVQFLTPVENNLVLLYISSTILVTVIEGITGFLLEKIFIIMVGLFRPAIEYRWICMRVVLIDMGRVLRSDRKSDPSADLQGVDNDSICSWNYSYGMSGCRTSGRPVCNSFRYSEDEPQT